jgi:hypothetical protein
MLSIEPADAANEQQQLNWKNAPDQQTNGHKQNTVDISLEEPMRLVTGEGPE